MLRAIGPIVAFALMATVVACSGRDPVADGANNVIGLPAANANAPSPPDGSPPANATAPAEPAAPSSKIPAALQGRWGLTPGDCTSALGDAKGLLVVNGRELRFYESRAVPSPGIDAESDSITGNFRFTGEGQNWTKFEKLERRDNKLVRTESNPAASYIYAKC